MQGAGCRVQGVGYRVEGVPPGADCLARPESAGGGIKLWLSEGDP